MTGQQIHTANAQTIALHAKGIAVKKAETV